MPPPSCYATVVCVPRVSPGLRTRRRLGPIRRDGFVVLCIRAAGAATGERDQEMGDESVLRARAREAMKAAELPDRGPERVWGGPGSGATCALCGKTLGRDEVELELQFTSDGGLGGDNYRVHARCFAAWELERRSGSSSNQALLQADNAGIMPGRERNATNRGEGG